MYTVLWIDDELAKYQSEMDIYAKRYRIKLVSFETKNQGMEYFKSHYREIDAIILDGLFVVESVENEDVKEKALIQALDEIKAIEVKEGITFPRVIYTGQQQILGDSDFEDNRGIKVFEKVDDPEELFKYVNGEIEMRQQSHLRKLYGSFADICDDSIFDGADLWMKFLPQLEAIHSNNSSDTAKQIGELRRILDRITKAMTDYSLVPSEIANGSASLTLVSIFLNGKVADLRREGLKFQMHTEIFPTIFCRSFRFILDATGIANHEEWEKDQSLKDHSILEYDKLIPNNHLVQTATFIAMDLVIAVHEYITKNPNKEMNASKWGTVKPTSVIGVLGDILNWGGAYLQPDGSTSRDENVAIPKDIVNEHQLAKGIRMEVSAEQNKKGNWQLVDVLGFPHG